MTSCSPHYAHHCLVTLYLIPTDPPDGSPSCSVEPALNYTSLRLLCSWSGGFPSPSLKWTGDLKGVGQDEAGAGQQTNPLTNTAIVLPSEGVTINNSLFTCTGSHVALKQSTECSTRTCKQQKEKVLLTDYKTSRISLKRLLLHQIFPLQSQCVLPM